jgi:DNA damage-binding protein 1
VHSSVYNGAITMLQKLRPKDSATSLLFVGTNMFDYFTLEWDSESHSLKKTDNFHDVGEKYLRDSQSQDRCIADPSGRYLALMLWEGVLLPVRLRTRGKPEQLKSMDVMEQIRLTELFIRASTFIHSETGHPKVAFLYQSRADSLDSKLAIYRLTSDDKDTTAGRFDPNKDRELSMEIEDPGATLLIPVDKVEDERRHHMRNVGAAKAHLGGILIVGESKITYVDDITTGKVHTRVPSSTIFVAWAKYNNTNYILGDDYGSIYLLTLLLEGDVVINLTVNHLGKASRASCLEYIQEHGLLFVGSQSGDSQVYKVDFQAEDPARYLTLVQRMGSIGPVLDFAVMDMGNREDDKQLGNEYSSGQARIVSGSGAHRDGSLKSVRSGVGLEDIGILGEFQDVRGLYSIRSHGSDTIDTLVASFLTETRVFRFGPEGEIEEVPSFQGLSLEAQTLLATSLPNNRLLQATPEAVSILDAESGVAISRWTPDTPEATITNVSANAKWVLLSVEGKLVVSLNIEQDLAVSAQKGTQGDQAACLHASPDLVDVGVVGFWTRGVVTIVDLPTLEPRHGESIRRKEDNSSIPRDIALVQILPPPNGPSLFIAVDDGNVVSFSLDRDLAPSARKSVILGTQQARFHILRKASGLQSIFVTTEHPSLIYSEEGRIVYSAVTAEGAHFVSPFDTQAFPDSVVLATADQIKISKIDEVRQTHYTSLPMYESVRRIAYSPSEKVFGLGCIRRDLVDGEEIVASSFRLVDDITWDNVGKEINLIQAPAVEMVEAVIRAQLTDSYGKQVERFIVGTSLLADPHVSSANDELRGRILVIGIDSDRNPYIVTAHKLKGACRCLAIKGRQIVAALTKTVVLFEYQEETTTEATLTKLASYRSATYPIDLAVEGEMVAVADMMKSISLIEYVPNADDASGGALVERCRHYQSSWATAVCHVEGSSWLEADQNGNLMVLRRNADGVTREDQRRMEITSELNLGEMVNRIRKINVETSSGALVIPKAFLGTVGSVLQPTL